MSKDSKTSLFKLILVACIFMVTYPANLGAAKHALLVAVTEYVEPDENLPYCDDDIDLVRNMLIQVGDWSTSNITRLVNTDAYEDDILDALDDLANDISTGDTVLFMYSGHGSNPYGFYGFDGVNPYGGRVSPTELNTKINAIAEKTDKILVILDISQAAVFNGDIDEGVILMASSYEPAWQSESLHNSVFSEFIGQGMEGYADLNGASISAEELFDYAAPLTSAWVEDQLGKEQTPLIDGEENDFNFLVKSFTLGGALSHHEIWSGSSLTLTGNVTVPSGVTLTLMYGVEVNFNSKSITISNGGTLVIKSDLEEYNITVSNGGTLVIYSDLEVPSGSTIAFSSGSTLELNGYTISEDGGTIAWYGRPAFGDVILWDNYSALRPYSTVQSALSSASAGDDISLGEGGFTGSDIYMKYEVDIIGSGTGPSGDMTTLWPDVIFDYTIGYNDTKLSNVYVDGIIEFDEAGYGAWAHNVRVNGSAYYDIDMYDTQGCVTEADLYGGNKGVNTGGYTWACVGGGCELTNYDFAIYVSGSGYLEVGGVYFCDQNHYDVDEVGSASVMCWYCTWSGSPYSYTYGNVDWYPEDYETCGMYRALPVVQKSASPQVQSDSVTEAIDETLELYGDIRRRHMADREAGNVPDPQDYVEDINEMVDQFKAVVSKYPDHPSAPLALGGVVTGYRLLQDETAVANYLTYTIEHTPSADLKAHAQSLMVSHYRRSGQPEAALALADEILSGPVDEELAGDLLYRKGLIYERNLNDPESAALAYNALARQYTDHASVSRAMYRLETLGEEVPAPAPAAPEEEVEPEVTELSLEGYPNPFNPTATVRFGLPEAGSVTLIVYDLLGREVVRLAEGYYEAGWQSIIWDGRDAAGREVPTGLYIARLVTPQGVRGMKLIMMK